MKEPYLQGCRIPNLRHTEKGKKWSGGNNMDIFIFDDLLHPTRYLLKCSLIEPRMNIKERENFNRNSTLIVEDTKEGFSDLIELNVTLGGYNSFENSINDKKHDIYHLCYNRSRCCQCPPGYVLPRSRILHPSQLEILLDKNGPKRPCHNPGRTADFCCCFAHPGLTTNVLDITLARCLLVNFCQDVFLNSCLTPQKLTLEDFLTHNKHHIYHLYDINSKCCQCPPSYVFPTQRHKTQWNQLFSISCSPCSASGPQTICASTVTPGITVSSLYLDLSQLLIDHCCLLKQSIEKLVEIRNNTFGHAKEARIPENEEITTHMSEESAEIRDEITSVITQKAKEMEQMIKIERQYEEQKKSGDNVMEHVERVIKEKMESNLLTFDSEHFKEKGPLQGGKLYFMQQILELFEKGSPAIYFVSEQLIRNCGHGTGSETTFWEILNNHPFRVFVERDGVSIVIFLQSKQHMQLELPKIFVQETLLGISRDICELQSVFPVTITFYIQSALIELIIASIQMINPLCHAIENIGNIFNILWMPLKTRLIEDIALQSFGSLLILGTLSGIIDIQDILLEMCSSIEIDQLNCIVALVSSKCSSNVLKYFKIEHFRIENIQTYSCKWKPNSVGSILHVLLHHLMVSEFDIFMNTNYLIYLLTNIYYHDILLDSRFDRIDRDIFFKSYSAIIELIETDDIEEQLACFEIVLMIFNGCNKSLILEVQEYLRRRNEQPKCLEKCMNNSQPYAIYCTEINDSHMVTEKDEDGIGLRDYCLLILNNDYSQILTLLMISNFLSNEQVIHLSGHFAGSKDQSANQNDFQCNIGNNEKKMECKGKAVLDMLCSFKFVEICSEKNTVKVKVSDEKVSVKAGSEIDIVIAPSRTKWIESDTVKSVGKVREDALFVSDKAKMKLDIVDMQRSQECTEQDCEVGRSRVCASDKDGLEVDFVEILCKVSNAKEDKLAVGRKERTRECVCEKDGLNVIPYCKEYSRDDDKLTEGRDGMICTSEKDRLVDCEKDCLNAIHYCKEYSRDDDKLTEGGDGICTSEKDRLVDCEKDGLNAIPYCKEYSRDNDKLTEGGDGICTSEKDRLVDCEKDGLNAISYCKEYSRDNDKLTEGGDGMICTSEKDRLVDCEKDCLNAIHYCKEYSRDNDKLTEGGDGICTSEKDRLVDCEKDGLNAIPYCKEYSRDNDKLTEGGDGMICTSEKDKLVDCEKDMLVDCEKDGLNVIPYCKECSREDDKLTEGGDGICTSEKDRLVDCEKDGLNAIPYCKEYSRDNDKLTEGGDGICTSEKDRLVDCEKDGLNAISYCKEYSRDNDKLTEGGDGMICTSEKDRLVDCEKDCLNAIHYCKEYSRDNDKLTEGGDGICTSEKDRLVDCEKDGLNAIPYCKEYSRDNDKLTEGGDGMICTSEKDKLVDCEKDMLVDCEKDGLNVIPYCKECSREDDKLTEGGDGMICTSKKDKIVYIDSVVTQCSEKVILDLEQNSVETRQIFVAHRVDKRGKLPRTCKIGFADLRYNFTRIERRKDEKVWRDLKRKRGYEHVCVVDTKGENDYIELNTKRSRHHSGPDFDTFASFGKTCQIRDSLSVDKVEENNPVVTSASILEHERYSSNFQSCIYNNSHVVFTHDQTSQVVSNNMCDEKKGHLLGILPHTDLIDETPIVVEVGDQHQNDLSITIKEFQFPPLKDLQSLEECLTDESNLEEDQVILSRESSEVCQIKDEPEEFISLERSIPPMFEDEYIEEKHGSCSDIFTSTTLSSESSIGIYVTDLESLADSSLSSFSSDADKIIPDFADPVFHDIHGKDKGSHLITDANDVKTNICNQTQSNETKCVSYTKKILLEDDSKNASTHLNFHLDKEFYRALPTQTIDFSRENIESACSYFPCTRFCCISPSIIDLEMSKERKISDLRNVLDKCSIWNVNMQVAQDNLLMEIFERQLQETRLKRRCILFERLIIDNIEKCGIFDNIKKCTIDNSTTYRHEYNDWCTQRNKDVFCENEPYFNSNHSKSNIRLGHTEISTLLNMDDFMAYMDGGTTELNNSKVTSQKLKQLLRKSTVKNIIESQNAAVGCSKKKRIRRHVKRLTLEQLVKQFFKNIETVFPNKSMTASSKHLYKKIFDYLPFRYEQKIFVYPINGLQQYFEQMSVPVASRPPHAETMKFEWVRVRSYWSFPSNIRVSPIAMARVGFYYTGKCSECRCFSCGVIHREWRDGDDPYVIHQQISPNCFYLNGQESGNVPIHEEDRIKPRHHVDQSLLTNTVSAAPQGAAALPDQIQLPGLSSEEIAKIQVPPQRGTLGTSQSSGDFSFRPQTSQASSETSRQTPVTQAPSTYFARPPQSSQNAVTQSSLFSGTSSSQANTTAPSLSQTSSIATTSLSQISSIAASSLSQNSSQLTPRSATGSRTPTATTSVPQTTSSTLPSVVTTTCSLSTTTTGGLTSTSSTSQPPVTTTAAGSSTSTGTSNNTAVSSNTTASSNTGATSNTTASSNAGATSNTGASSNAGASSNTTVGAEPSRSRFDPLGINFEKPRYPAYAVLTLRVNTYNGWPSYLDQSPRTMAKAGFFYAGYGDYTRCFFCGGGLRNWEAGDDPWVEHARWFPKCAFLKQNRGDNFVNMVQTRHQEAESLNQPIVLPRQLSVLDQGRPVNILASIPVQTLREMGKDDTIINEAIDRWRISRQEAGLPHENSDIHAIEIYEVILQIEDEREEMASSQLPGQQLVLRHEISQATSHMSTQISQIATAQTMEEPTGAEGSEEPEYLRGFDKVLEEFEEQKERLTCKICIENPVAIAFLPCGHLVCCLDCAPAMRKCPVCHELVKGTIKTFFP